jgi:hypothetical protein
MTPGIPKATSSLSFDVRNVGSGGGATGPSSFQRRASQVSLELKVRNLSAQPASAEFEWYFVANWTGPGGQYVWSNGSRSVSLGAGAEQKETLQSTELVETTSRWTTSKTTTDSSGNSRTEVTGHMKKEGARPQGWIVRMFVDGKLVRVQGSSPEFEKVGYDAQKLAALQAP